MCVFPSLFALAYSKEAWVMDIWDSLTEKGRGRWNPCFFKPFNDYEVEVVKIFLVRLHGKRVCGDVEDTVLWTETKSGKFWSNLSTMPWSWATHLPSPQEAFGTLGAAQD